MADLSRSRRTLRVALAILAAGAGLAAIYSCSLIVDTQSQQCQKDGDCNQFGSGAVCDTVHGACVSSSTSSGTGSGSSSSSTSSTGGAPTCDVDGGIDGGGCYSSTCDAGTSSELLNVCTTGCIAFDNSTLKGLLAGGATPMFPSPGPDGGM